MKRIVISRDGDTLSLKGLDGSEMLTIFGALHAYREVLQKDLCGYEPHKPNMHDDDGFLLDTLSRVLMLVAKIHYCAGELDDDAQALLHQNFDFGMIVGFAGFDQRAHVAEMRKRDA